MKKSLLLNTLVGSLSLFFAGQALAGPGKGGGFEHRMRMLEMLNPTAEQRVELAKLRAGLETKLAPFKAELMVKKVEMENLWRVDNPDKKAVLVKAGEIDDLRKKMREAHIDFRLAVLKTLTPEQREKIKKHAHRMGMGFGPDDGFGRGRQGHGPMGAAD